MESVAPSPENVEVPPLGGGEETASDASLDLLWSCPCSRSPRYLWHAKLWATAQVASGALLASRCECPHDCTCECMRCKCPKDLLDSANSTTSRENAPTKSIDQPTRA